MAKWSWRIVAGVVMINFYYVVYYNFLKKHMESLEENAVLNAFSKTSDIYCNPERGASHILMI